MTKKRTTIWIKPDVHRALKVMAAEHGVPVGDVLKALLAAYKAARVEGLSAP